MTQGPTKGIPLDADGTLAANSDLLVATQKATKTYADAGYRPGGTDVAVADGGTGASTAAAALSNLGGVPTTLADANSVLYAVTDDTPAALAMGASTILARLAAGNIVAATPGDLAALLGIRSPVNPTGALAATFDRTDTPSQSINTLISQRLSMVAIGLWKGMTITSITFLSGTTALSVGVNQLFGLYDLSRNLLRGTVDDTSAAWASNTAKTLNLTSTYDITATGIYYLAALVNATTLPSLTGRTIGATGIDEGIAPITSGISTTGVTALPNPAAALTSQGHHVLAWVN